MTAYRTRRQVMTAVGGGLATAALGSRVLRAASAPTGIDVHHHFAPPFVLDPDEKLDWTTQHSLDDMDQAGIAKAVLSPATSIKPARDVVRRVNEYGAKLVSDHPTRFGQFVYLPLPDVDAALAEIAYGLDVLKTDGVGLATNYGEKYLSDDAFTPVLEELNRRKAVTFVHPKVGACCRGIFPKYPQETSFLEFPYDSGRLIVTLLLSGAFRRYRDIKWIFCHAGGPIPMFDGRIKIYSQNDDLSQIAPDGIDAEFRRLHYETASSASALTLGALLKLVPASQVMFGSDHPYVTDVQNANDLHHSGIPPAQIQAILGDNARRLMPRLAS